MSEYQKKRLLQKQFGKEPEPKKIYTLNRTTRPRPISEKKQAEKAAAKKSLGGKPSLLEQWFQLIRTKLTGLCGCGCGEKSSKFDDAHFRSSCCHIFPKNIFKSVMYHPENYVERRAFGGCHTNLDTRSMDLWPNMEDWCDIVRKFYILDPLLTAKEKTHKFYKHLSKLVHGSDEC